MLQLLEKKPYFEQLSKTSKKQVSILATSMSVTDSGEEVVRVAFINYPVQF